MWVVKLLKKGERTPPGRWWGTYANDRSKIEAERWAKQWNATGVKTNPLGSLEEPSYGSDLYIIIFEAETKNEWGEISP